MQALRQESQSEIPNMYAYAEQKFKEFEQAEKEKLDKVAEKVYNIHLSVLEEQIEKCVDNIHNSFSVSKLVRKVMKHLNRRFPEHNVDETHLKAAILGMFFENKIKLNDYYKVVK